MTRLIRTLLVVMVAAVSVSVVISTADARAKKPGEVTKPKSCKLPDGLGTLESGGELLEEGELGGVNVYSCSNGTVCLKAYDSKGRRLNGEGDCWYDPAIAFPRPSSGPAVAPSVTLAITG